jgi:uncharacterized protein
LKNPSSQRVPLETGAATTALVYEAPAEPGVPATLILGHGAGAGQQSGFMVEYGHGLPRLGLEVVTFNFLYTEQGRRIPDRAPVLEACFRSVVEHVHAGSQRAGRMIFIGGKSMGGRIATQIAALDPDLPIAGLVLLGYPLHPPGKPAERRDKHLSAIRRPMLFVQGTRDPFGSPAELKPALDPLDPAPRVYAVDGGDHSFKVPRKGATQAAVHADVQRTIVDWIASIVGAR